MLLMIFLISTAPLRTFNFLLRVLTLVCRFWGLRHTKRTSMSLKLLRLTASSAMVPSSAQNTITAPEIYCQAGILSTESTTWGCSRVSNMTMCVALMSMISIFSRQSAVSVSKAQKSYPFRSYLSSWMGKIVLRWNCPSLDRQYMLLIFALCMATRNLGMAFCTCASLILKSQESSPRTQQSRSRQSSNPGEITQVRKYSRGALQGKPRPSASINLIPSASILNSQSQVHLGSAKSSMMTPGAEAVAQRSVSSLIWVRTWAMIWELVKQAARWAYSGGSIPIYQYG